VGTITAPANRRRKDIKECEQQKTASAHTRRMLTNRYLRQPK
jgi:hypothetical protein